MNAINAYNRLNANVAGLKKASEKLASGYRINRAGDDAAGLAISEKMRSQIKGLNQAVRNSQDGINMIQTYEGAAQESHNILRRMKELASEAANGTYQNEVDRDAVQLEFNQLNDELNQIADTDFNGVVMLNGGQTADGTKAVNGKFDYVNPAKAATKLGKSDVSILGSSHWDNMMTGVLSHANSATAGAAGAQVTWADEAWASLNATWKREPGKDGQSGPDSVDVTFKYDAAANTWTAIDASNGANKNQIKTEATENGGFRIGIAGVGGVTGTSTTVASASALANVVIDTTKLTTGDTITLTFHNPATGIDAPTNADATLVENASSLVEGSHTAAVTLEKANDLTVTLSTHVTDPKMTDQFNSLIEKLNNAQIELSFKADAATTAGDMTIKFSGSEIYNSSTQTNLVTVDGVDYNFVFTSASNQLQIKDGAGNTLITIDGAEQTGITANGSAGNMVFDLAIEASKYNESARPTIEVAKTGSVSKANSYGAATAPMTYTDHLVLQTGARTKDSVDFTMEYSTEGMGELKANLNISSRADGLNTANLSLNTQESANYAIDRIDNAINKVSMVRATFGATQNRLEHKIDNLTTTAENIQEAESSIRDTDMANEMMNYTKFNILQQAAQSMLAQANQQPQSILQLLG